MSRRPRFAPTVLVLAATVLSGCAHGGREARAPDSPSGAVRAWEAAVEGRSLDRVVALYGEDAVLMPPSSPPLRGREGVRRLYREQFERFRTDLRLDVAEVVETPDWAYARGTVEVRARAASSDDRFTTTISFVMILRPADGEWRIARHIWNLQEPFPDELPPHP